MSIASDVNDALMASSENDTINVDYFKQILKEYLKLDDEIKKLSIAIKQRRDKYAQLSQSLLLFLNQNKINEIQLEGQYQGKELISEKTQRVKTVSSKNLMEIINSTVTDSVMLDKINQAIKEREEAIETEKVKISKSSGSKNRKKKALHSEQNELTNALLLNV